MIYSTCHSFLQCAQHVFTFEDKPTGVNEWFVLTRKSVRLSDERLLFQGDPDTKTAAGIVADNNFDPRLYGTRNGSVYGPGTYFATTAKYSHAYSRQDNGRCLVCQSLDAVCLRRMSTTSVFTIFKQNLDNTPSHLASLRTPTS